MSQKGNKIMINVMCRQWLLAVSGSVRAAICVKCLICENRVITTKEYLQLKSNIMTAGYMSLNCDVYS